MACACDDGALRVLDAATLAPRGEPARPPAAHGGGAPYLAAVVAVGDAWIVGGASRGLSIVDAATGAVRGELRGVDAPPRALAAVPGTPWVVATTLGGELALWDVAARALVGRVALDGGAWSVAAASSAAVVVGTRAGSVVRVELPALATRATARVHAGPLAAIAALPDGRLATGGDDRAVRLIDLDAAAAARPAHGGAVTRVAAWRVSSSGGTAVRVVSAGADGALKLWDGARGLSLRTAPAHDAAIAALARAGATLFTAAGAEVRAHVIDGDAVRAGPAVPPAPAAVHALAAAGPDAVVAACADGAVRRWTAADATGWSAPLVRHDAAALAVALDGDRVVSGGADSLVRTADEARRGHGWEVHAACAARGVVVTAARDGVVAVWEAGAAAPRLIPGRHAGAPGAVALTPDGGLVATATRDDCVVVWRSADGGEVARWTADAPPTALAFADGRTLAVGDAAGEVMVLELT